MLSPGDVSGVGASSDLFFFFIGTAYKSATSWSVFDAGGRCWPAFKMATDGVASNDCPPELTLSSVKSSMCIDSYGVRDLLPGRLRTLSAALTSTVSGISFLV